MVKGVVHFAHGIEVGNTFKLGTKYSKALDLQYLDQNNQLQYVWMVLMVLDLLVQWLPLQNKMQMKMVLTGQRI